jgi:hypothetical protein
MDDHLSPSFRPLAATPLPNQLAQAKAWILGFMNTHILGGQKGEHMVSLAGWLLDHGQVPSAASLEACLLETKVSLTMPAGAATG